MVCSLFETSKMTEPFENNNAAALSIAPARQAYTICVATSKAGHPILSIDPQTGASACICAKPGISNVRSLTTGCHDTSNENSAFLFAYGGASTSNNNQGDSNYCVLISTSCDNSGSSVKWKCRLPEYISSKIETSPCGQYVVAGGSGNCYIWSLSQKGLLLNIWKCHYGPVTCVRFSECGQYIITAGMDGIVHAYPLVDLLLVGGTDTVQQPMHSWSEHDLQVTDLCVLTHSHGRFVSSSHDQRIVIMELFSGQTLARIQMPLSGVNCLTTDLPWSHVLFAGSVNGFIYCLDLDVYAIASTTESRVSSAVVASNSAEPTTDFISELHGHVHPVSSIAFLPSTTSLGNGRSDDTARLISGDELGCIRVWSVKCRVCTLILHPWSCRTTGVSDTATVGASAAYPCSAILIINNPSTSTAATAAASCNSNKKKANDSSSSIYPLRRFTASQQQLNYDLKNNSETNTEDAFDGFHTFAVSRHQSVLNNEYSSINGRGNDVLERALKRQRLRQKVAKYHLSSGNEDDGSAKGDEVVQLKKKLLDAEKTIARWEAVNNKLLSKLNKISSEKTK